MLQKWIAFTCFSVLLTAQTVTINGHDYAYTPHPRIWFDGPSGPITTSLKDPDGMGGDIAPKAKAKSKAYDALLNVVRPLVKSCDSPEGPCADPGNDRRELFASLAALDWYMDNRQNKSKNYAIWQLNHIELVNYQFQFGCIEQVDACGLNSWEDWPSEKMLYTALAYTLMRDQLSDQERALFASKMLNGVVDQNCVNQFQIVQGVSISYIPGSTVLTGSGLLSAGLIPGQLLHFKRGAGSDAGVFAKVLSVDSDNQITLDGKAVTALKADASAVNLTGDLLLYKLNAWSGNSCGQLWQVAHHPYNSKSITRIKDGSKLAKGFQPADSSIQVADPTPFGNMQPPFSIYTPKDRMRVTALDGNTLTVDRGQWNSTPSAATVNGFVGLLRYPRSGGLTSNNPTHNLVFQKIHGYIHIALALLDDDPRAAVVLDRAVQDYQEAVPLLKQLWTGLSQGGSSSYGLGRWTTNNSALLPALRSLSLDYTDGDWMKQFVYYLLYFSLPNSRKSNVAWGQSQDSMVNYNSHKWIAAFQTLYPGSDEAQYARYWETDYTNQYTTGAMQSNPHMVPWYLIFASDDTPRADFTKALPTQYAFRKTDLPSDKALGAWISRTGWTKSDDTLVAAFALGTYAGDHVVLATSNPGSYKIFKNGWALTENAASEVSYGTGANIVQIGNGTAVNLKGASTTDWQNIPIDRAAGDPNNDSRWACARIDLLNAYTAVAGATRAFRYLAHLKGSGKADYLFVYDDVATNKKVERAIRLHYDRTGTEVSTMDSASLPDLVWTGPNRRLSTKVLLPTNAYAETNTTKYSYEYRICSSTAGGACDQSDGPAEFLVVHRPSTSTKDTMPPVSLLPSDQGWACAGVTDKDPKVACFPRGGAQLTSLTFTSAYQGDGQVLITGLPAGLYAVDRSGTRVGTFTVKAEEGAIYLEGPAGTYALTAQTQIGGISISPQNLAFRYPYGSPSLPQQFQAFCTTPSCTLRATPACAWLAVDPATVSSSGVFSVSINPDSLSAGTYQCSVSVALDPSDGTQQLLTVDVEVTPGSGGGPELSIITDSIPDVAAGEDYSFVLEAAGGTPPYIWSIDSGDLPPGIALKDTGEISGISSIPQSTSFTVSVRDSASPPASTTKPMTINVVPPV